MQVVVEVRHRRARLRVAADVDNGAGRNEQEIVAHHRHLFEVGAAIRAFDFQAKVFVDDPAHEDAGRKSVRILFVIVEVDRALGRTLIRHDIRTAQTQIGGVVFGCGRRREGDRADDGQRRRCECKTHRSPLDETTAEARLMHTSLAAVNFVLNVRARA